MTNLDFISKISKEQKIILKHKMQSISPDDWRYSQEDLKEYLTQFAELKAAAIVQRALLETRIEFGKAQISDLKEFDKALEKFDPRNVVLIEKNITKHDQLAVIEELWRYLPKEVKAKLHPWTTSYDIVDTARAYLLKKVFKEKLSPLLKETIKKLVNIAIENKDIIQVWRTHIQDTSPIIFWTLLSNTAKNLADRYNLTKQAFNNLKWKVSWIVWTWASIEMVIWKGKSEEFEKKVLEKLDLKSDTTATQIVQKYNLADLGHNLVMIMHIIWGFANDMRLLYSTAISEVTSLDAKKRLWGSSADASKNNPINYENIAWKIAIVESGMRILYELCQTDLQRDLRGSIQARYQPQAMISQVYESLKRLNKELEQLSVITENIWKNLEKIRKNPSEALVAILRWESWTHSKYWVWHSFVKQMAKIAKENKKNLIEVCLEDQEFKQMFENLSQDKKDILNWMLEKYIWHSKKRLEDNCKYVLELINT